MPHGPMDALNLCALNLCGRVPDPSGRVAIQTELERRLMIRDGRAALESGSHKAGCSRLLGVILHVEFGIFCKKPVL
jgi:hypothetical protein